MKQLASLFLTCVLLLSCGQNGEYSSGSDSINSVQVPGATFDTTYEYNVYTGGVTMSITRNDSLVRTCILRMNSDTVYYGDGCIKTVSEGLSKDFEEQYCEYDHEYILRHRATQYGHDGMGGSKGKNEYYDTTGKLISTYYNDDYLPVGGRNGLDNCGVITIYEYYSNGQTKSERKEDHHYEGVRFCPCGDWKYYDSTGKLLRTEHYQDCGEGNTDCEIEQAF